MQTRFGTTRGRGSRKKIKRLAYGRLLRKLHSTLWALPAALHTALHQKAPKEWLRAAALHMRALIRRMASCDESYRAWPALSGFLASLLLFTGALAYAVFENRAARESTVFVTFSYDGMRAGFATHQKTVAALLDAYGLALNEADTLNMQPEKTLADGDYLFLRRATTVYIADNNAQEHPVALLVPGGTVAEALKNSAYSAAASGSVTPGLSAPVYGGMIIEIDNVTKRIETATQSIPFKEITEDDIYSYKGLETVSVEGVPGERQITTQIIYINGIESSRSVISAITVREPVDRVVKVGVKPTPTPAPAKTATPKKTPAPTPKKTAAPAKTNAAGTVDAASGTITVDGKTYSIAETIKMEITAYTNTGNKTATGKWPQVGMIAVNTAEIPYGTKVYIPGYGLAVAEDTGVAEGRIDVFMNTYDECIQWGRKRNYTVYILE